MKCIFCTNDKPRLAKTHIFPIGFFNKIETKGQVSTYRTTGEKGRRLQKAIYDDQIICQDCEHTFFEPLDDYAIKVLRDKQGVIKIITIEKDNRLYIFDNIDKKRLRHFFASILWRASISRQLEVRSLSIGQAYENRIRDDLINDAPVDYIDLFVTFLTDPMHNAFFLPYRKKFAPIDTKRESQNVNGWIIQFPNIHILLSMDKRRLPNRISAKLSDNNDLEISTSIHPDSDHYKFVVLERRKDTLQLNQIINSFIKSQKWDA